MRICASNEEVPVLDHIQLVAKRVELFPYCGRQEENWHDAILAASRRFSSSPQRLQLLGNLRQGGLENVPLEEPTFHFNKGGSVSKAKEHVQLCPPLIALGRKRDLDKEFRGAPCGLLHVGGVFECVQNLLEIGACECLD
jgi:hypothetical protein